MKISKLWILTVLIFLLCAATAGAQKSKPQKPARKTPAPKAKVEKSAPDKTGTEQTEKVRDLVAFFQLLLNTLGSNATSARDKDVVITESYSKIFRDDEVQVEDDLDEARTVITNKGIVAYLKDVDFFFQDVTFDLVIDDIREGVNANGKVFFKVSLRRNLNGTTAAGKAVNNTIPRFIEVNYDEDDADLKIVSVYTNEFDESVALTNWWKSLSFEWQSIFKRKLNIIDSVDIDDIKDMTSIDELDLGGNIYIRELEALAQLTNLKMLNLGGTNVEDLTPIRNLTALVELNLSGTKVFDLSPLKYSTRIERLNINDTEVRSIAVLEKMVSLKNLEMRNSHVVDFTPLAGLSNLQNLDLRNASSFSDLTPAAGFPGLLKLDISGTAVTDLKPAAALTQLHTLDVDSTRIRDFRPLSSLAQLEVLHANHTAIADLGPLRKLEHIERIYCDQTLINKAKADDFMDARPDVLVIFDSRDLMAWWEVLSPEWQRIFSIRAGIASLPAKEELAKVTNIDSLDFGNNRAIKDLEPLRRLQKLRVIIAPNTGIASLEPLEDHRAITYLDVSDTEVSDLSVASKFSKLTVLRADRTKIEALDPLYQLKSLRLVYVDRTAIHDITAREFLQHNPASLIIFKTIHLERWWGQLDDEWKGVFRKHMGADTTMGREKMHQLVEARSFSFSDARVHDLGAFSEFVRLESLHFSGTAVREIPALENFSSLESLHATNSPIQEIGAIPRFSNLQDLDLSNTPLSDLKGLEGLENLKTLNCAGTQIRKLDPLDAMHSLGYLDCSNTLVRKLTPVTFLFLRTLKCYNTKISSREVDKFRERNPECQIIYYR